MNGVQDPTHFQVDLSNCDREPIHLLGAIQHFGFLVAVSTDWLIQRVSRNIGDFAGRSADDLLGIHLGDLFGDVAIHSIRGRLQVLSSHEGSERLFGLDVFGDGNVYDAAVHLSGHSIVIECEPAAARGGVHPNALVKSMIARVQRTRDIDALYQECVRQLRSVTGFDRVMLYRFNADGAGTVTAESARSGIEPYLGLNYPATDIPKQARALYIRNRIRIIADVNADPVPVEPALDPNGDAFDLSLSILRSVSPIHIEYLKNMGVGASFSISIVIDDRLWGLFALHHYGPRYLSMEMRSAVELFGQMVSLVIEGRLAQEQRLAEETARDLHDRFLGKLMSLTPSVSDLADFANDLREIIPSDGFAVWAKGEVRSFGKTPYVDDIPGIARFLNRAAASRVYTSDELGAVYPNARDFSERAAGLLAIPISRSPRDYLLFFRKEIVQTVTWAGDPTKKEATFGPNGPRLSPRKSFEAWQETVRGKSRGWSEAEKRAAEALRVSILEVLVKFNEESERQQLAANQQQELLIAELNHRVRNILALIRALVTQSRATATTVDDFARTVGGRVQALARAHDQITDERFAALSLHDIIQTEFEAYVGGKASRVVLEGPEVLVGPKAFQIIALVFHEMVTNSAKYGALSDSRGTVNVVWSINENDCCEIRWREQGGPAVVAPTRRGFGSTIIERSIPHDLGGETALDYQLSGLRARFVLPPHHFESKGFSSRHDSEEEDETSMGPNGNPRATDAGSGVLDGLDALLVEDNMIISLDAEHLLESNGASRVHIAASVNEAMKIIDSEHLDIAMLDVNLGRETSFPLVGPLKQRGIPFVFVTGYGESIEFPEEAGEDVLAVKKPFATDDLLVALGRAIGGREHKR